MSVVDNLSAVTSQQNPVIAGTGNTGGDADSGRGGSPSCRSAISLQLKTLKDTNVHISIERHLLVYYYQIEPKYLSFLKALAYLTYLKDTSLYNAI